MVVLASAKTRRPGYLGGCPSFDPIVPSQARRRWRLSEAEPSKTPAVNGIYTQDQPNAKLASNQTIPVQATNKHETDATFCATAPRGVLALTSRSLPTVSPNNKTAT